MSSQYTLRQISDAKFHNRCSGLSCLRDAWTLPYRCACRVVATRRIIGASIHGVSGDEAIHGLIDVMQADVAYDVLQWAVPIHPTVSELWPLCGP